MHLEILSTKQHQLLPLIKQFGGNFGLVGGTAIALHLGHRRSIDFDLFNLQPFDAQNIRSTIRNKWKIEHTFVQGESELTILVNQVKLTFYHFPYPITFHQEFQGLIRLPDLLTLGAMKAFALGKRSKWKDYVDLYFLLKYLSFGQLVQKAEELFGTEFNQKLFRVQLNYFADIDYSEEVEFMPEQEVSAEDVKQFLEELSLQ